MGHVKDLQNCHASPTDWYSVPRTALQMKRLQTDWSSESFFYPQNLSMTVRSRSVGNPAISSNILVEFYWRRIVKDERDAIRTSIMGL